MISYLEKKMFQEGTKAVIMNNTEINKKHSWSVELTDRVTVEFGFCGFRKDVDHCMDASWSLVAIRKDTPHVISFSRKSLHFWVPLQDLMHCFLYSFPWHLYLFLLEMLWLSAMDLSLDSVDPLRIFLGKKSQPYMLPGIIPHNVLQSPTKQNKKISQYRCSKP